MTKPTDRPLTRPPTPSEVAAHLRALEALYGPTDGELPLFVNVGNPSTDAQLERLFTQENGG